jgi:hypothetical protein
VDHRDDHSTGTLLRAFWKAFTPARLTLVLWSMSTLTGMQVESQQIRQLAQVREIGIRYRDVVREAQILELPTFDHGQYRW